MSPANEKHLFLYEEIMLLALRDEEGTVAGGYLEHAVAGAILAELLLDGRISIEASRKQLVDLENGTPTGDPIIDEVLEKLATAKRRAPLQTWVSRLTGLKNLRHRVARRLCDRGILRADEDTILFLFTRKVYPEINPEPEKEIVDRLRIAIFSDEAALDPRTIVLISLANGTHMLSGTFGRKELKERKQRIEQIAKGDVIGKAAQEVVIACQAAVMVPAITAGAISSS